MRLWGYFLLVKTYLSPACSVAVMWLLSEKLRAGVGSLGVGLQDRANGRAGFGQARSWVMKNWWLEGSAFPNGRPYLSWSMRKFYLDVVKDLSAILGRAPDFLLYLTHPFSPVGTGSGSLAELRLAHELLLCMPWYNCLAHHGRKQLRSIYSLFLFFR